MDRLQRCIKEVSRLTERVSVKRRLEKPQLQQLDRNLNELARALASKVMRSCYELGVVMPSPFSPGPR